jgi:hypothetical protein
MVAVAELPLPPSLDTTLEVTLVLRPVKLPTVVTFIRSVQLCPAGIVPPASSTIPKRGATATAPPQLFDKPVGDATVRPGGNKSANATPDSDVSTLGFVNVKVKVVVAPRGSVVAPNTFEIDAGNATTRVALAVFPAPPSVEVTAPDTLSFTPAEVPLTSTLSVQVANGGIDAPDSDTDALPATAVAVPPQEFDNPFGDLTTNPEGKLSLNPTPDNVVATFGFDTVNVKLVDPFTGTAGFPNTLMIDGGATTTTDALAVFPVPPSVELTVPVVLVFAPAVAARTLTENTHWSPAGSVASANEIELVPAPAVIVPPPHEPVSPFGDATSRPDGKVSLNPTPDSCRPFEFDRVNVNDVVAPNGIDDAPNAFPIDGGDATTNDALAVLPVPPSRALTAPVVLSF